MGFLDRLLGRPERPQQDQNQWGRPQEQGYRYGQQSYQVPTGAPQWGAGTPSAAPAGAPGSGSTEDERAVERYRYLLRTAPPERIEEVHAEAFATLTPEQRRMVYDEFTRSAPAGEAPRGDDPRSLAQAATRSEIRQPGFMERSLGGMGGGAGQRQGPSFGRMVGASILGTVAGYVIGSAIMSAFLPDPGSFDGGTDAADDGGAGDTGGGYDEASADGGSDWGGGFGDDLGGDLGGGFDI